MKVLFCSPYLSSDDVVKGGINSWGNYVVSYHRSQSNKDVELLPISFDRKKHHVGDPNDISIKRIFLGIIESSKGIKCVQQAIAENSIDVMHICTSASLGLTKDIRLLRIAKKYKIKSVLHLHFGRASELQQSNNWEWKLLLKAIHLADNVVAIDGRTYKVLTNVAPDKISYLPNPLAETVANQISMLKGSVSRASGQLLFVGHALKTKGVYELIEGCKAVPSIKLHLVGKISDEMRADLERIAGTRDGGKWVSFLGEMSHEDVLKEFLSSEIFIFPSYTEGFPNVILEAMACGCAIASSNVGAIPDMLNIHECPCGICFDPQSVTNVTDAVNFILNNSQQKQLMVDNAIKRVHEVYSMSTIWNELQQIWSK